MKRWIPLLVIVAALMLLALSAGWWLPPFLDFVGANSDVIQGLTDLVQLALWIGAAVVGLVGWWQTRRGWVFAPVDK